jgi:glycosyltransferase involved in cell wall biosynthesis
MSFDFVNSSEIEPIFKASDIVVLPYRQVSQSGILNIALNFHKPVILSDLFAEKDLVKDKMGKIVRPGKPSEIAKAAISLLSEQQFYDQCRNNMESYTNNDNTWKETALVVKKLIDKFK